MTHNNSEDTILIKRYLEGEEEVLPLLIERYLKAVYNFVYRYTGNRMDAEDLTQEIFVKMWSSLKKFDWRYDFRSFLFTIAKNHCFDWLRKKKIRMTKELSIEENMDLIEMVKDTLPLPSDAFDQTTIATILSGALDQLTEPYRLVLSLYYHNQFSLSQIGEMLHEPVNTVKSRYRRGIVQLRTILARQGISAEQIR
jgi:RNA polymerase sigma-70 factor (ECF subfamily)